MAHLPRTPPPPLLSLGKPGVVPLVGGLPAVRFVATSFLSASTTKSGPQKYLHPRIGSTVSPTAAGAPATRARAAPRPDRLSATSTPARPPLRHQHRGSAHTAPPSPQLGGRGWCRYRGPGLFPRPPGPELFRSTDFEHCEPYNRRHSSHESSRRHTRSDRLSATSTAVRPPPPPLPSTGGTELVPLPRPRSFPSPSGLGSLRSLQPQALQPRELTQTHTVRPPLGHQHRGPAN
mmetsp:Transcript_76481/g.175301  ORF Transcript_76481/g.175301 Transcript_76481/m.175301 type:complete len:234 (-) Transcript_76481:235-936(-)